MHPWLITRCVVECRSWQSIHLALRCRQICRQSSLWVCVLRRLQMLCALPVSWKWMVGHFLEAGWVLNSLCRVLEQSCLFSAGSSSAQFPVEYENALEKPVSYLLDSGTSVRICNYVIICSCCMQIMTDMRLFIIGHEGIVGEWHECCIFKSSSRAMVQFSWVRSVYCYLDSGWTEVGLQHQ